jgi:tetratricopeptide (TPR) repeat protein
MIASRRAGVNGVFDRRPAGDTLLDVRRVLFCAASLLLLAPVQAAADWRALRTNHFQVVGDVSAQRLREVALRFEQFREVVTQLLPAALRAGSAPVVAIVFPDAGSYRPFMPVANGRTVPVDGSFVDGADTNYITLNVEAGEQAYPAIFHELSHLLLNNAFAEAPLWFTEGLAEYFSTFQVTDGGRRVLLGNPISRHVARLRERRMKLSQLFAIGPGSKEYTQEGLERELFYAHSWALVHYARHAQQRRFVSLESLARRLADGEELDESVRATYGMDLETFDAEVQAYVRKADYTHVEFSSADGIVMRVDSEAAIIDDADVEAWLGDLLAHLQRGPEAIPRLERALQIRSDQARALATLGILRVRQGNRREGLSLLERAAAAGLDVESVQFEYGWALATEPVFDAERAQLARSAFERALALRPGYPAAIQMLASVYGRTGDFSKMRDLLAPLVGANRNNQDAALQLAAALLGLGDFTAARALVGPILARPHDDDTRERARTLLGQISKLQQQP